MKTFSLFIALLFALLAVSCSGKRKPSSPFSIKDTDQTIELREDSSMVLVYHKKPASLDGRYVCNNYIHPLYDPDGNVLTEEFPADHPYHRGVFWAWHQLYAGGKRLGDGWTNDSIYQEVSVIKTEKEAELFRFTLDINWFSTVMESGKPFMNEQTAITVHRITESFRKIDFEIALRSLVPGLQIGGSADPKGYGGLCVRLRTPDSLIFTSVNGRVMPQELQLTAGPWMDISAPFGQDKSLSGVTILNSSNESGAATNWILRQKGSMQNIVFPGNARIDVPADKPVVLKYRLIIHKGDSKSLDCSRLQQEYSQGQ